MDRSATSTTEHSAAMRVAGAAALDVLLPAAGGERRQPAIAPATRRVVSGASVLWHAAHGRHAGREPQARPEADAHCRYRGALSQAEPEPSGAGPRDRAEWAEQK